MPSFAKPSFTFDYDADAERAALRNWRDTQPGRAIPAKDDNRLLLATWNIANLGAQDRGPKDYALLAEVVSWFDLVAVQEVKNNRRGLDGLMAALPASWRTVYSDAAGNDERMTFVYDSEKVKPRELTGEVAVAPSDLKNVIPAGDDRGEVRGLRSQPLHRFVPGGNNGVLPGERPSLLW
jgi:hypothetical protein